MGGITADCADFTLFTNPVAILSNMYTHFVTVLPLIVMVVSTLATPDLAGRNHGLRRRGLSGRAGHGRNRGSGCKAKSSSAVSVDSASSLGDIAQVGCLCSSGSCL
jgi:hypothetical protein